MNLGILITWIRHRLRRPSSPQEAGGDPWVAFLRGRALDDRRDAAGAFRCYLVASQGGHATAGVLVGLSSLSPDADQSHKASREGFAHLWPTRVILAGLAGPSFGMGTGDSMTPACWATNGPRLPFLTSEDRGPGFA